MGMYVATEPALEGWPVGWFAPEYKLLIEAWRELKFNLAPVIRRVDEQQKRIELKTGGVIEGWAFDRNPNAGRSRRYKRVVVDEAAHCDNLESAWTRAIRPTLSDFKGDGWFLSSPNGRNYFHTLYGYANDRPEWRAWTFPTVSNPYIDPSEIESARLDLPDAIFRQEYLAEFLAETAQQLIPDEWLDRSFVERRPDATRGIPCMACDVSKGSGRDRTVIFVADDLGLLDSHVSNQTSIMGAAGLIARMSAQWGVPHDRITYDAGGWAGPDLGRYLEAEGIMAALPYYGSAPGGTRYKNRRMRSAWRLRQRFDPERPQVAVANMAGHRMEEWSLAERRRVQQQAAITAAALPAFALPINLVASFATDLRRELSELRYTYGLAKLELEKKDDLVERLGHSPDLADTLIMLASIGMDEL